MEISLDINPAFTEEGIWNGYEMERLPNGYVGRLEIKLHCHDIEIGLRGDDEKQCMEQAAAVLNSIKSDCDKFINKIDSLKNDRKGTETLRQAD